MTEHQEVLCLGGPRDGEFMMLHRDHDQFMVPDTPRRQAYLRGTPPPVDPVSMVYYRVIVCQRMEDSDHRGPLQMLNPFTARMEDYEVTGYWKVATVDGRKPTDSELRDSFFRCRCHLVTKKWKGTSLVFATYEY